MRFRNNCNFFNAMILPLSGIVFMQFIQNLYFRYPFVIFYFWVTAVMFYIPYRLHRMCGFDKIKTVVDMLQNPVDTMIISR